jgi:hypothetical protein
MSSAEGRRRVASSTRFEPALGLEFLDRHWGVDHPWSLAQVHGGFSGDCDDEGRASKLNTKVDWIREIIEFWTAWTCTDFTTPSGQSAAWCWDDQ